MTISYTNTQGVSPYSGVSQQGGTSLPATPLSVFSASIADTSNDGQETQGVTNWNAAPANIFFGFSSVNFNAGFRFSPDVAQYSNIVSAKLTTRQAYGTGMPGGTIYGANYADAPGFDSSNYPSIMDKTTATAPVVTDTNTAKHLVDHDVTDIVQELVDRVDWVAGNAMSFLFISDGVAGLISIDDVSSSGGTAAMLTIEYSDPLPAPLNANLLKADLDGKCLVLHDSQCTISFIRFGAQLPLVAGEFSRTIMGHHVPGRVLGSVGSLTSAPTVTGMVRTDLDPGSNWPAQGTDSADHWNKSSEFSFAQEPDNFVDIFLAQADADDFASSSFDMSGPMCFRAGFVNHANSVDRISLREYRGTTAGNNANYGNGGSGTNYAGDVEWSEDGSVVVCHKGIRGAASMGGGSTLVGAIIETSGTNEINKELRYLGAIVHKTGGTSGTPDLSMPGTGTMFTFIGASGWSAYDLINRVSDEALQGMIRMVEGFDTIIIPLGHNVEDSGTFAGNLETLANRVLTAHTNLSYDQPKIILAPTWSVPASADRMFTQSKDAYAVAAANSWGFVNLHRTYNGQNPANHGKRIDGTPATYSMDGGTLLHPTDETTAKNIARDFFEHFEDAFRL